MNKIKITCDDCNHIRLNKTNNRNYCSYAGNRPFWIDSIERKCSYFKPKENTYSWHFDRGEENVGEIVL